MLILAGIILLVIGLLAGISLLFWLGVILLVVGLIVALVAPGGLGHPVGGRRRYWY